MEPSQGPNLLIICADQWRGQALGFLEQEPVLTPNLDRLAAESLVLTHAVSNYPVCSPYRAMLMTGIYPHANGVLGNCNSTGTRYGYELRREARCWSDVLDDRGYSLGYVGKWHLEAPRKPYVESYNNSEKFAWNEWTPPARRHGFRFWYAYNTFDRHLTPEYWASDSRRDQRVRVEQWGPEHEADVAVQFIRNEDGKHREATKPFSLVVSMNPPHMPYRLVPEKYVDRYKDKSVEELLGSRPNLLPPENRWGEYTRKNIKYQYAMMTGVDEQIGRILKSLDEIGERENTIVVFTSDHGDCLGLHGMISKNNHFEESMRIPLLVRWPEKINSRTDDLLISVPDVYPTLMELMGFTNDVPSNVEGTSYARLFRGEKMKRPSSQLYMWVSHGQPSRGRRGIRTHRFTLMIERRQGEADRMILHDNKLDPYQLKNIAGDRPGIVAQLIDEELNPWLKRTSDPWLSDETPD
ncbi:MAG: sulfatase [Planctomycetaceae bacterium]|nr:sulfatase [Planctomycetaceae bacterium]